MLTRIYSRLLTDMLFLFFCFVTAAAYSQTSLAPNQMEGATHRKAAEMYFENLHNVPQGYNWRVVNNAVRNARYERLSRKEPGVQEITTTVSGTWTEVGSVNQAGRVVAVEYDHSTKRVWVAGAGGTVWVGHKDSANWKCLTDDRKIADPVLIKNVTMPDNSENLVVVSGGPTVRVLNSAMGRWTTPEGLDDITRWGGFSQAEYCVRGGRMEIYAVGYEWDYGPAWRSYSVLYRSVDTAKTFQRLRWFSGVRAVWSDRHRNVLFVHGDTLSAVEPDGTIRNLTTNSPWSGGARSVLIAGSQHRLGFGVVHDDSTMFYTASLQPLTFSYTSSLRHRPFDQQSFTYDFTNGGWLFGAVNTYSADSSLVTWREVNGWAEHYQNPAHKLHADIPEVRSFELSKNDAITFIGTDGGLYQAFNGADSVLNISLNKLNVSQYYSIYTSRDDVTVVLAGSQDQGFQRSTVDSDGPRPFEQTISGDYSSLVSPDGVTALFCVYPGFVMYLPNMEYGWEPQFLNFPHKGHLWVPPLASGPSAPEQCWLGGGTRSKGARVYVYTSTDGKLTIDSLSQDFAAGKSDVKITALTFAPSDDNYAYVTVSDEYFWRTTNRGASWTSTVSPRNLPGHYFSGNALAVSKRSPTEVFLGGSGYNGPAVYHSTNSGTDWQPLAGLPPCLVLNLTITPNGRWLAAATDAGAFIYDMVEETWTDITALGAPDQTYWDVDYIEPLDIFRFGTYGRGIWDFKLQPIVTDVSQTQHIKRHQQVEVRPRESGIVVAASVPREARCSWYDLSGRCLYTQDLNTVAGDVYLATPPQAARATMVVVVTTDGIVATSVLGLQPQGR